MVASRYGHIEVAKLLVEKGANIKSKDDGGWTPLMSGIFLIIYSI